MRKGNPFGWVGWSLFAVGLVMASPSRAHDLVEIGASSTGQLQAHHHIDLPIVLPVSPFSSIPGFATAEMAFHGLAENNPSHGLFTLVNSANVQLTLVSSAQNAHMLNQTTLGNLAPGESLTFGGGPFDYHSVVYLDSGIPGVPYPMTFRLHDAAGIYSDSAPFTLTFTPVPEPSWSMMVVAGGALMLTRRRFVLQPARV